MTKRYAAVLAAVLIMGLFAGCAPKPTEHPNDTLVAYQEPKNDKTGITYGLCTMTWADGAVTEVHIDLTYDTEENASTAYDGLVKDYGDTADSHNIVLDGNLLSYDLSTASFTGASYEDMIKSYKRDGKWTVIEE
jgi:hypothetical protein